MWRNVKECIITGRVRGANRIKNTVVKGVQKDQGDGKQAIESAEQVEAYTTLAYYITISGFFKNPIGY